jgi:hypothetical protein
MTNPTAALSLTGLLLALLRRWLALWGAVPAPPPRFQRCLARTERALADGVRAVLAADGVEAPALNDAALLEWFKARQAGRGVARAQPSQKLRRFAPATPHLDRRLPAGKQVTVSHAGWKPAVRGVRDPPFACQKPPSNRAGAHSSAAAGIGQLPVARQEFSTSFSRTAAPGAKVWVRAGVAMVTDAVGFKPRNTGSRAGTLKLKPLRPPPSAPMAPEVEYAPAPTPNRTLTDGLGVARSNVQSLTCRSPRGAWQLIRTSSLPSAPVSVALARPGPGSKLNAQVPALCTPA